MRTLAADSKMATVPLFLQDSGLRSITRFVSQVAAYVHIVCIHICSYQRAEILHTTDTAPILTLGTFSSRVHED